MKRLLLALLAVGSALAAYAATVTDDFNDGNLTGWTASIGAGLVNTGTSVTSVNNNSRGSFYTGTVFTNDQYAQAVINTVVGNRFYSVEVRGNGADSTRDAYQCTVGATDEYYITEVTNSAGVDLASGTTTLAEGDLLGCEAQGTTITLKINTVTIDSVSDGSLTSGAPGLAMFTNDVTGFSFDDFEAGDLGGGGGSAVPVIMQQIAANDDEHEPRRIAANAR